MTTCHLKEVLNALLPTDRHVAVIDLRARGFEFGRFLAHGDGEGANKTSPISRFIDPN